MNWNSSSKGRRDARKSAWLGTFGGVFMPSVLTILGIILFRRLGFIVGSVGLWRALAMLTLATVISVLTSISPSAIATNRKVKGGGDYYLISRTLSVEFGSALGLILYAAQAVSIAFYCVGGFGEGLESILGGSELVARVAAAIAAVGLFGLAYLGVNLATGFQYVVMLTLGAALVSFFAGAQTTWEPSLLALSWKGSEQGLPFRTLFAIFFHAVTGFTHGVSMSGDLNMIAVLVSMFFPVSSGLLNYATYVEVVGASPSFHPRFRFFHARASLAGTWLCGFVILMIDPMPSAVALAILGSLRYYLRWTVADVHWHDSRPTYRFRRVKDGLRELSEDPQISNRLAASDFRVYGEPYATWAVTAHGWMRVGWGRDIDSGPAHPGRRRVARRTTSLRASEDAATDGAARTGSRRVSAGCCCT